MALNSTKGRYHAGQIIHHWTLLEAPKSTRDMILCRCKCGKTRKIVFRGILDGKSTQCGSCRARQSAFRHGLSHGRLYKLWEAMKCRCSTSKGPNAHLYHGRGITVCAEWVAFIPFYDWSMANGYTDEKTLDRINNDLGYTPKNCRWTTYRVQSRNRRILKKLSGFGENKLLCEWVEDPRCAVKHNTLVARLRAKWDLEKALTTPTIQKFRRKAHNNNEKP